MAERFGRYWLHEKIGHGGMAEVFRATLGANPHTRTFEVAIKRLHYVLSQDERQRDMFLAEAYLSKLMVHPNIVRAYESGDIDGRLYIAMEMVEGPSLDALFARMVQRRLRMPPDLAIFVIMQILRAVDYIHDAKAPGGKPMDIIHRDLTPSNIYLTHAGEVKVADFGVARVNLLEPLEDAGLVKGKVGYTPPEVVSGAAVTQGADLWSVAVCLFELVAGRRLFEGANDAAILADVDAFKGLSASSFGAASVERELAQIIGNALHVNPHKRPESAARFYKVLKTYAAEAGFSAGHETLAGFVGALWGAAPEIPGSGADVLYAFKKWLDMARIELDRSRRHRHQFCVLFVDVDNLASINEQYGSDVGDSVIDYVARVVLASEVELRSSDVVGRRDADKFLLLLPETPLAGGVVTANRARDTFRRMDWGEVVPGIERAITASVGVASYPEHADDVSGLVDVAEVACYQAKEAGKDATRIATGDLGVLGQGDAGGASSEAQFAELRSAYRDAHAHDPGYDQRLYQRSELQVELIIDNLHAPASVFSEDLSLGGVRVRLPIAAEIGDEITLGLVLPGEPGPIPCRGRVVWRRRDGMVGLTFVELPPGARDRLLAGLPHEGLARPSGVS